MPRLERERAAKLALLEALASSQRAVARMLESTAELHARFPGDKPEDVAATLARLAGLQLRMCESLLGLKLRRAVRGRASAPWLADGLQHAQSGNGAVTGGGCRGVTSGRRRRAAADGRVTDRRLTGGGVTGGRLKDGRVTNGREPE